MGEIGEVLASQGGSSRGGVSSWPITQGLPQDQLTISLLTQCCSLLRMMSSWLDAEGVAATSSSGFASVPETPPVAEVLRGEAAAAAPSLL